MATGGYRQSPRRKCKKGRRNLLQTKIYFYFTTFTNAKATRKKYDTLRDYYIFRPLALSKASMIQLCQSVHLSVSNTIFLGLASYFSLIFPMEKGFNKFLEECSYST